VHSTRRQSKSKDHGRLRFDPGLAICRKQLLLGVFSPRLTWSTRVRVVLATSVLALSSGASTTSVASEPDDQHEGVVVPGPGDPSPGEPTQSADPDTPLPYEVEPVPSDPLADPLDDRSGDSAPLETEPPDDPDAGLLLTDPGAPDTGALSVPPVEPVAPTTSVPPAEPPAVVDVPPPTSVVAPPASDPTRRRPNRHQKDQSKRKGNGPATRRQVQPPATSPPGVPTPALGAPTSAAETVGRTTQAVEAPPPPPGIPRFHVVKPGESLWSIGAELLGPEASAGATALEVRRLWQLNGDRIGTGDPDLLPVGVKLRLR
jgi:hypothetical protein